MIFSRNNSSLGLFLVSLTFVGIFTVPVEFSYAYRAECQFNQTYSDAEVRDIAENTPSNTSVSVGPLLNLIKNQLDNIEAGTPKEGELEKIGCTVSDAKEAINKLIQVWEDYRDLIAVKTDPSATVEERAKADEILANPNLSSAERAEEIKKLLAEAEARRPKEGNSPLVCADINWWDIGGLIDCGIRSLVAGLGALIMYIGILALTGAGLLFQSALEHTVVNFSSVFGGLTDAVNTAWTAFRDIANILIIGIFTFIALSIILGLKEYGQKKLIARVLIIAVLINFSLLFTKMVVDASNYAATLFYTATLQDINNATLQDINNDDEDTADADGGVTLDAKTTSIKGNGIAGSFMKFLGVGGLGDSYTALREIQEGNDSSFIALLYGAVSFVFLIAVALVFLYGTYLLVSRAVLIIFLMITASVAFASYLVPKWSGGSYGFEAWKSSLINSAALAPLLMFLLWGTYFVSEALSGALCQIKEGETVPKCGTLGALITEKAPIDNITALLNFVIILGLLFITFKLSSSLAKHTAGLSATGSLARSLAGIATAPFALGARGVGFLGQRWRGDSALEDQLRIRDKIAIAHDTLSGPAKHKELVRLQKKLEKAQGRAQSSYNFMNTDVGKGLAGAVGLKGFWAGQSKTGGVAKTSDDIAKEVAKKVGSIKPTNANRDAIREDVSKAINAEHDAPNGARYKLQAEERQLREKKTNLEKERETAKLAHETAKTNAETAEREERNSKQAENQAELAKDRKALETETDPAQSAMKRNQLDMKEKRLAQELETFLSSNKRIEDARKEVTAKDSALQVPQNEFAKAAKELSEHEAKQNAFEAEVVGAIEKTTKERFAESEKAFAHVVKKALPFFQRNNPAYVKKVEVQLGNISLRKKMGPLIDAVTEETAEQKPATPKPPAAPGGAH